MAHLPRGRGLEVQARAALGAPGGLLQSITRSKVTSICLPCILDNSAR